MVSWPDIKRLGRCELGISWGYDRYAANLSGGNLQKINLIESDFCRTCVLLPFRRVFYKFCWKVMRWVFMDVGMNWFNELLIFLTENNLPGTLNITLCIEYYWISYEQLNILLAGNLLVGVGHDNSWSMYWIVVDILFLYEIPKVHRK